jgi:hypothetical protein
MDCRFCFQDPNNPETTYLYEALLEQVRDEYLVRWRGIFAFASAPAIKNVFEDDPDVNAFLKRGQIELFIGLDAITNERALLKLQEIEAANENLSVFVFKNDLAGLFHPKTSFFEFANNSVTLVVGSGNFTPGGLRDNMEAYCVTNGQAQEFEGLNEWDDFLERHAARVSRIDDDALERGRANILVSTGRGRARRAPQRAEVAERPGEQADVAEAPERPEEPARAARQYVPSGTSRMLIAEIPAAGGRWRQIHYNRDVIDEFFRVHENSAERVFLREVRGDGLIGEEEIRPVVFSTSNKNLKIEVSARKDVDYPEAEGKPLILLRELGVRNFLYMIILPGENGYAEARELLYGSRSIGRGVRRTIVSSDDLHSVWRNCPLLED